MLALPLGCLYSTLLFTVQPGAMRAFMPARPSVSVPSLNVPTPPIIPPVPIDLVTAPQIGGSLGTAIATVVPKSVGLTAGAVFLPVLLVLIFPSAFESALRSVGSKLLRGAAALDRVCASLKAKGKSLAEPAPAKVPSYSYSGAFSPRAHDDTSTRWHKKPAKVISEQGQIFLDNMQVNKEKKSDGLAEGLAAA